MFFLATARNSNCGTGNVVTDVCLSTEGVCLWVWQGCLPPSSGGVCLGGVCLWVQGGVHPPGRQCPLGIHTQADTPLGRPHLKTATAADDTHPTGMHSCVKVCFLCKALFL